MVDTPPSSPGSSLWRHAYAGTSLAITILVCTYLGIQADRHWGINPSGEWGLGQRITSELTLAALNVALDSRGPGPGCIHHSDRGVQYAAAEYLQALAQAGLRPSMSRKGNPYDNAYVESFMKTFKVEEVYLREYLTYPDVMASVPRFIEAVYNRTRRHSSIGRKSPVDFEAQQLKCTAPVIHD